MLFNPSKSECRVIILHEGEKINIPVDPKDPCFFEEEYFNPITKETETFNDIKEIKMWVEDDFGNKADHGKVKIEYPRELDLENH